MVTVVVLDINDNPPRFNSTFLNLTVAENEPSGTIVGEFVVVDSDQGLAASLALTVLGDDADRLVYTVVSYACMVNFTIQ